MQGMLEAIVMLVVANPLPRPVAIEAYSKLPISRALFKACDGITVKLPVAGSRAEAKAHGEAATRVGVADGKAKRPSAVREALEAHRAAWAPGKPGVAILPEGTTSNGRVLLKFFSGAFEGGAAIQPVVFYCPFTYWNGAAFLTTMGAHIVRMLVNPWQRVVVSFEALVVPTEAEQSDAAMYAERVRTDLAAASGLPLSPYDAKMLRDEDRLVRK